jgi:class 3 adenylate cyclase
MEGERKLITVLFADVANYTAMTENLDPEDAHTIIDGCFEILTDEIHSHEGSINQFTGDGVMALFGAPVAHEDHAQRACHAALAIQKAIAEYSLKVEKDYGVPFKMRIGLNSGPVIVGSIVDDLRMDYTALGDTTNLAARLEHLANPGTILISKGTQRLVRDFFEFKPLGRLAVKGKKELQEAFELLKTGTVATRIGASVAKGLTRFVGRKNSMSRMMDCLQKARGGVGQVVGLIGEAGVGKSRLLLEMRQKLSKEEHTYLEGRCIHYGGSMVYLPILDILRTNFDIKEEDREPIVRKKLAEKVLNLDEKIKGVIPPFQELLSLKVDDQDFIALDPLTKRERTFEALRDLLVRVSQEKLLVIAVEDLHWIDKTSEEFLDYLIGWVANTHILLILLYRPEYTHQWSSRTYYTKIGLNQLGTRSSSQLVKTILEEGEVVPELKQLILNRGAGNPLFMEEFTHSLLEDGSIERQEDRNVLRRQVTDMREELKSYLLNLQGLEFIYEKQLKPYYAQGYLFLGGLYLNKGSKGKAVKNLKMAEEMFQEMRMDYWLKKTQKVLERL